MSITQSIKVQLVGTVNAMKFTRHDINSQDSALDVDHQCRGRYEIIALDQIDELVTVVEYSERRVANSLKYTHTSYWFMPSPADDDDEFCTYTPRCLIYLTRGEALVVAENIDKVEDLIEKAKQS